MIFYHRVDWETKVMDIDETFKSLMSHLTRIMNKNCSVPQSVEEFEQGYKDKEVPSYFIRSRD